MFGNDWFRFWNSPAENPSNSPHAITIGLEWGTAACSDWGHCETVGAEANLEWGINQTDLLPPTCLP